MEALTPREWAYWCMSEKLDPAGGHHELASLVASQVINALHGIAAGLGGGQLSEEHMLPVDAFVPWRKRRDVAAEKLSDSLAALESLRGL